MGGGKGKTPGRGGQAREAGRAARAAAAGHSRVQAAGPAGELVRAGTVKVGSGENERGEGRRERVFQFAVKGSRGSRQRGVGSQLF